MCWCRDLGCPKQVLSLHLCECIHTIQELLLSFHNDASKVGFKIFRTGNFSWSQLTSHCLPSTYLTSLDRSQQVFQKSKKRRACKVTDQLHHTSSILHRTFAGELTRALPTHHRHPPVLATARYTECGIDRRAVHLDRLQEKQSAVWPQQLVAALDKRVPPSPGVPLKILNWLCTTLFCSWAGGICLSLVADLVVLRQPFHFLALAHPFVLYHLILWMPCMGFRKISVAHLTVLLDHMCVFYI